MPKISVVIPAYNVGRYLSECLASISSQDYKDFEALVINDASTDDTAAVAAEAAGKDERIRLVEHPSNMGTHLTRRTGVQEAKGEYTFFLDGDDALAPSMLSELSEAIDLHPADIMHFGITVTAANGTLDKERQDFESFNNKPTKPSQGLDIVRDIFDEDRGQQVDWRFTQRLYKTALLKKAFAAMTDNRLGRSQDGYECFVTSALAQSYQPIKECRGYCYYYGRGISGTAQITPKLYARYCREFQSNFAAAYDFANSQHSAILQKCALGFEHKGTEILANDWLLRIDDEHKAEAAHDMSDIFGPAITGREIYRFIRDRAYDFLHQQSAIDDTDPLWGWKAIADRIFVNSAPPLQLERYQSMRSKANEHLSDLKARQTLDAYNRQRIRIFVTTHKKVDIPKSEILQPVQVGPGLKKARMKNTLHDDDGTNISEKNPRYCELTTQYWAWKNVDADYYGFCHYRRYFDFSKDAHRENPYGEIMDDYIDDAAIKRYGLDDATISATVKGYDVITTGIKDLRTTIDNWGSPLALYRAAPDLYLKDLQKACAIVMKSHPDYSDDVKQYLHGHYSCFCNMFIMRKDLFFAYCQWLFPILDEFEQSTDMSAYSQEGLRTPGHLAERLFNIWLIHQRRIKPTLRTKELQCVHFTHPEQQTICRPLELADNAKEIIPVVFAANDAYVPMLTTAIYSLLSNASDKYHYDIVVLERDISKQHKAVMRKFLVSSPNITLRFVNVEREIAGCNLTTSNQHISIETYYRFIIQTVLPFYDKVLYLDSDLVVNDDIAELYNTDLGTDLLAAIHDIDYLGNLNNKDGKRLRYSRQVLGMRNPYSYFQAGVLLLNTAEMRKLHSLPEWLRLSSNSSFIYNDQDVLNAQCQGRVTYLDWSWNVIHDCDTRLERIFSHAPANAYYDYLQSRKQPRIIHYAGFIKPWNDASCDLADVYWSYARQTPFYESLIQHLSGSSHSQVQVAQHERVIAEDNGLRRLVDPIAPIGSARREILKTVARAVEGRH